MNAEQNPGKKAKSGKRDYDVPGLRLVDLLILNGERFLLKCLHYPAPPSVLAGLWEVCAFSRTPRLCHLSDIGGKVIGEAADHDAFLSLVKYLRHYAGRLCPITLLLLQGWRARSRLHCLELDLRTATAGEISIFLHKTQGGGFAEERAINRRIEWLSKIAEDCFDAYFRTRLRSAIYRSIHHPDWFEGIPYFTREIVALSDSNGGATFRVSIPWHIRHGCDRRAFEIVVSKLIEEGIEDILAPYHVKSLSCDRNQLILSVGTPPGTPNVDLNQKRSPLLWRAAQNRARVEV